MKRNLARKAVLTATATGLLLATAACSSGQKPAALSSQGVGATNAATSSATPSSASTVTSATSSAASASGSPSAVASTGNAAPTSVSTAKGGWSYSASVPPDTGIAAALTAFQHYTALAYEMGTTVQHNNDLVNYADGNVLSLLNDFITQERKLSFAQQGPEIIKVTAATLEANATPPVVTITTCTDDTKLGSIVTSGPKKGQTAPASDKSAYLNIYKVHLGADGKWRVNTVTPEPDKSCSAR